MGRACSQGRIIGSFMMGVCGLLFLTGLCNGIAGNAQKQTRPSLEVYLKKLGYIAIPLERYKYNQICVEAQIGGKRRRLLVDSGSMMTTLDPSVARKFKRLRDLGGKMDDPNLHLGIVIDGPIVVIDDLNLGPARFPNQPAMVQAIKRSVEFSDGIIGLDFLIRHFCLLDCSDLRLYARAEELKPEVQNVLARSLEQSGYVAAELDPPRAARPQVGLVQTDNNAARRDPADVLELVCSARINGDPVRLLLDTGSQWTLLDRKSAVRCRLNSQDTVVRLEGIGMAREPQLSYAKPNSFEIGGGRPLQELYIGVADMAGWKFGVKNTAREAVDGTLGADFLALNGALIDFRRHKLWFEPAKSASNPSKTETTPR